MNQLLTLYRRSVASPYYRLMRLDKPIGTFLVLWPTYWGLWLGAGGFPSFKNLFIFTMGVLLMRAAGCVVNDIADRHIDKHVKRTQQRPITQGEVSPKRAWQLFAGLCIAAFILVLFTNVLTIVLSFGAVALTALYPYMKRHTYLPQVVLGAAFAWSVPMAYAAEAGTLIPEVGLVYCAVVLWTVAYDTFYAMVDRDDDVKIGVKSTAILFGDLDRPITAVLQCLTLASLALAGRHFELGAAFHISLLLAAILFAYQQLLIRYRQRQPCFMAFLNNNWVGLVLFLGVVLGQR